MQLADFDYTLPPELVAQEPPPERGASRLLVLDRAIGRFEDREFRDLAVLLNPDDLLVFNDSRVFSARLLGRRLPGGGSAECLLVRRLTLRDADDESAEHAWSAGEAERSVEAASAKPPAQAKEALASDEVWEALVHPGQRLKEGSRLEFGTGELRLHAEVLRRRFHGRRTVRLWSDGASVSDVVDAIGHMPLPPYIRRPDTDADRTRYQTVFARARGSIAAPTAGLHFTEALLAELDARGIERTAITLHVGYGTFQPIRSDEVEAHRMEAEHYEVSPTAARALTRARSAGRRIVAVGTTTTRTLESLRVDSDGRVGAGAGRTTLFVVPGHRFRLVSGLVTNFHLPKSSLILLVSAFAGRERLLAAYRHAVAARYRFYSYGDAMLVR